MTGYSFPFAPHVPFLSSAVTRPPSGDLSLPRALPLTALHVLFCPNLSPGARTLGVLLGVTSHGLSLRPFGEACEDQPGICSLSSD